MDEPKISVIVPVYNTQQYVEHCLVSLAEQTHENLEIVVVDDGSTDKSAEIIKRVQERYPNKIQYFYQQNSGQGKARNVGIEKCTGDYIGFLDSDDYADESMFEKMYKAAKENDADYVACGLAEFYRENGVKKIIKPYVASRVCETTEDLYRDIWVSPCLHLYKSEIIKNSGVKFPEGIIYEDTAFFINLIPYIKKPACVEEALLYRRRHGGSTMTIVKMDKVLNIIPVIDDIQAWYEKSGFNERFGKLKEYVCVRILTCSSIERISKIRSKRERRFAVEAVWNCIEREFPNFRKNECFGRGKRDFYIKHASFNLLCNVCELMHVSNAWRSNYK